MTKEIGLADTMRFLGQYSTGAGNYTDEREVLFGHLALDDILADIKAKNSQSQA